MVEVVEEGGGSVKGFPPQANENYESDNKTGAQR